MKSKGIIVSILIALTGLMMLSSPQSFIRAIVVLSGVIAIVTGFINLTVTWKLLADDSLFKTDIIVRGISSILIGIFSVVLPVAFAESIWRVMMTVLSIYLILSACMEIVAVVKLHTFKMPVRQYIIEIAITLILAILLLMFPLSIGFLIVKIGGGVLLLSAIILAFYSIKYAPAVVEPLSVEDEDITN